MYAHTETTSSNFYSYRDKIQLNLLMQTQNPDLSARKKTNQELSARKNSKSCNSCSQKTKSSFICSFKDKIKHFLLT